MYDAIDRETLKKKLDSGENIHLVEVLSEQEYERIHIAGAGHIQFGKIAEEAKSRFKKDDQIVVYCADRDCKASPRAAEKLDAFGFTNVFDYEAGKKDWIEAGYPVEGNEA